MKTLNIGSDHAGFDLKAIISRKFGESWRIVDHGTHSVESCDYPLIARDVCRATTQDNGLGILICGSGIGMSMAANRNPEIRAALCSCEIAARLARRHNDANILCLGARLVGVELALAITAAFLESSFEGGRHQRRIDLLRACASAGAEYKMS